MTIPLRQAQGRRSIFQSARKIEREFQEPLREVVAGFIPMGMTRAEVAETLSVNYRSLRTFCEKTNVRFPVSQPGRAERIREAMRSGPRSRLIAFAGRRQCLTVWAEEYGIKADTLRKRLDRGHSMRDALKA